MMIPSPYTKDGSTIVEPVSFEQFKERLYRPVSVRSKEDIKDEVADIRERLKKIKESKGQGGETGWNYSNSLDGLS